MECTYAVSSGGKLGIKYIGSRFIKLNGSRRRIDVGKQ
jgi:hypothetical protein